ncbi:hypothetical protein C8J57DRAFT_116079 [Mycena rebaudengoi]|nr:hypothetical protein C8J57DRAFT_116079 [Mycena rebaudengoi]
MSLPGVELHQLDTSVGVLFEGYVVTMALYGLIAFYTHGYFEQYPSDSFGWKLTIALLFCIDSTSLGVLTAALHEYMIIEFPLVAASVDEATKNYIADTVCAVTSIFIVQLCYVSRVWTVSKNRLMVAIISGLSTSGFALGLVAVVRMILLPTFYRFSEAPFKSINLCCQGLTFLAAALTFCTLSLANHCNNPRDSFLNRAHDFLLLRGGLATGLQLGHFITFLLAPSKHYWIIFHFITRRVFILSIIAVLTAREIIHAPEVSKESMTHTELSDIVFTTPKNNVENTHWHVPSVGSDIGNTSQDTFKSHALASTVV